MGAFEIACGANGKADLTTQEGLRICIAIRCGFVPRVIERFDYNSYVLLRDDIAGYLWQIGDVVSFELRMALQNKGLEHRAHSAWQQMLPKHRKLWPLKPSFSNDFAGIPLNAQNISEVIRHYRDAGSREPFYNTIRINLPKDSK